MTERAAQSGSLVPSGVEGKIHVVRGHNVLLDEDLAAMYGVDVRSLNQAVRRNATRFPGDFMFRLTADEHASLRSQTVILERGRGRHRKFLPLVFTEQGVAMLSGVLHSDRAVRVNIEIMRAFVRMRAMVLRHKDFARRLDELEARYDRQFKVVFDAIRRLMSRRRRRPRLIGFRSSDQ